MSSSTLAIPIYPFLNSHLRMFNHSWMIDAYSLAKIQEELIRTNRRTPKPNWNFVQSQGSRYGNSTFSPKMSMSGATRNFPDNSAGSGPNRGGELSRALVPVQKVTQAQMEEKRRKGLCSSCDAKWSRGLVCEEPKLFLIEGIEEEMEEDPASVVVEEVLGCEDNLIAKPEISLNAITGTPTPKTMRLLGVLKNQQVIILIDSGSTQFPGF